jgi:hypothetical protein
MSYKEFTLASLQETFQIELRENTSLFAEVVSVTPPELLVQLFSDYVPLATAIDTEKARSEFIIAPLLAYIRRLTNQQISIFSGIDFSIDASRGLNGVCDFLISLSPEQLYVKSPVMTVVEAKNDRISQGISQCIAEMLAVDLFNQAKQQSIAPIYGVVTTGSLWKFLAMVPPRVSIDRDEYHISDLGKILGIFLHMLGKTAAE